MKLQTRPSKIVHSSLLALLVMGSLVIYKWIPETEEESIPNVKLPAAQSGKELFSDGVQNEFTITQSNTNMNRNTYKEPLEDYTKYPCVKGLPVFPKEKWSNMGRCVRTFDETNPYVQSKEKCVPLKTLKGSVPICTYPANRDIFISESLQRNGEWEGHLVSNIARFLRSNPDAEFLDLGCNIGVYTLSIAHQGTKVTAMDPLLQNLQLLSQSLNMGKLKENVTLIWNAVSNEHGLVRINKPEGNIGGTFMEGIHTVTSKISKTFLSRTITLDDLLPLFQGKRLVIKIDIEGGEYKALLGGNQFFETVDVLLIQTEFLFHKLGKHGRNIVDFLSSKGLDPFLDVEKTMPLKSSDVSKWKNDVYFIKV